MQQHTLDDPVGPLAVLHDLFEIAAQRVGQFLDVGVRFRVNRQAAQGLLQFANQFGRDAGKIVDEIERVFDFVRDAGGKLAERGQLLSLHQTILCGAKFLERLREVGLYAGAAH